MKFIKGIRFFSIIIALILTSYIIINYYLKESASDNVAIQYSWKKFTKDSSNGLKKVASDLTVDGTICPGGKDNECKPGQHCVDGTCRTGLKDSVCRKSGDCDHSYYCPAGTCVELTSEYSSCASYKHPCKPGLICSNSQCIKPCIADGTCKKIEGSNCHIDKECEDNLYCSNKTCVKRLIEGSSCMNDQSCENNLTCKGLNKNHYDHIKNLGICSK